MPQKLDGRHRYPSVSISVSTGPNSRSLSLDSKVCQQSSLALTGMNWKYPFLILGLFAHHEISSPAQFPLTAHLFLFRIPRVRTAIRSAGVEHGIAAKSDHYFPLSYSHSFTRPYSSENRDPPSTALQSTYHRFGRTDLRPT